MKKTIFTLLIISVFTSVLFGQTRKPRPVGKRPPVVKPVKEIVEKKNTIGVSFERYVSTTNVNADGTATQTLETLQRFSSEAAIERFGKYEQIFNGDLERAEVLEAYVLKADGVKIPVPAQSIQTKPTAQAEAAPSFSSLKIIEVKFDGVDAGDGIFVKMRMQTLKPHFANHFDDLEIFPQIFEWKSIEINLSAPKDYPLYIQAVDLEGGKLADENGRTRWQWRRQNVPALEIETAMYDFYGTSPKLAVTSFKNFEELGAAYWSEAAAKSVVTPEIRALADEITKNIKEPQQQAYAIYEWVNKNVRYLSIVLERSGWIPHDAQQILANRYGDCKDYATVLNALLKAKNIESHPVIIRSDMTDWFPDVAVPGFFNHAILYIPAIDVFADATAPNTRLGLIPQTIVGKQAFLAGAKTGVIKVPDGRPEDNQLLSDIEVTFAADGSLKAKSKNIYQGRSEIMFRPMFADSGIEKNSELFVKMLLGFYGVVGTGKITKIGNPFKVGEPFDIELEVVQNDYTTFTKQGSLRIPIALNIIDMLALEAFVREETRRTSLLLGATHIRETFRLNLPEGVTVQTIPAAINFSNALGSYRNEFKSSGNGVELVREIFIKKDIISPQDYPQIRELITKMVESFSGDIKYQSNQTTAAARKSKAARKIAAPAAHTNYEKILLDHFDPTAEEKPLTVRQVAQMEAKLKQTPADLETRRRLTRHYGNYSVKATPANSAARIKHRLWFVQNRPELDLYESSGIYLWVDSSDDPEYKILKTEWLKQVAANESNGQIRLNAARFIESQEFEVAEKLLLEGAKIHPENYEFPLLLNEIYREQAVAAKNKEKPDEIKTLRGKAFENGETALALLKRERSDNRDDKRRELLKTLSRTALQIEKFDRARQFATELVLDFGQNSRQADYDGATHVGNIVLGLAALRSNDTVKAKEYLLIAIRAPLRDEQSYISEIDTELAKELFSRGEKTVVAEYLKLCENLWNLKNYPNLYEDEMKTLKLWQEQIKQGKTPSFDFDKP